MGSKCARLSTRKVRSSILKQMKRMMRSKHPPSSRGEPIKKRRESATRKKRSPRYREKLL
jgi:hypothetical protein